MTITARSKLKISSDALFTDPDFIEKLEHHLPILRSRATRISGASPLDQDVNRGDFRKVLFKIGIPLHMHWLIMRINGIMDPERWEPLREGLLIIEEGDAVLKGLITLHYTYQK